MLEHRVRTDPKTGLYNFEYLHEAIAEKLDEARLWERTCRWS
jgi:hypothetical protein